MLARTLLQSTRPSFLILTPVCILLGFSTAYAEQVSISWPLFIMIMAAALSAHVSVNSLNEYFDLKSGLDLNTTRTPFSGGSGALPQYPQAAKAVMYVGIVSLLLSVLAGIYFILAVGTGIVWIGLLGVVLVALYTPVINRYPFICLLAPGLGFGVLMVTGTQFLLAGEHSRLAWMISLIPFLLLNNLLLLNQYPDVSADEDAGRRTFPIAYGIASSNIVYGLFALLAYGWLIYLVIGQHIPKAGLLALCAMPFSNYALSGAVKYGVRIGEHPRYLAANVLASILAPLLLAISLLAG